MKITIENTAELVHVNGIPARVWEGKTESGVPCFALIAKIGVQVDNDSSQFERELKECKPVAIARHIVGMDFIFDADLDSGADSK